MISQPGRSLRADAFGLHDNFTSWAWEILCRRLSGQRGIVSSRVALLLRSAEIKPWLWDLCVRRSAIQHLLQWCTHCHRRYFFPFLLLHISIPQAHTYQGLIGYILPLYFWEYSLQSQTLMLSWELWLLLAYPSWWYLLCVYYRYICVRGQGSELWWSFLYGHTWLETPDPVRSPKLSNHGRV